MDRKGSPYMNVGEIVKEEPHHYETIKNEREQLQMEIMVPSPRQSRKHPHWHYILMIGIPVIAILLAGVVIFVTYQAHVSGLNTEVRNDNVSRPYHYGENVECPTRDGYRPEKVNGLCHYVEIQRPLRCQTRNGYRWEKVDGSCHYVEIQRPLTCPTHDGYRLEKVNGSCHYIEIQRPLRCPTRDSYRSEKVNGSCHYIEIQRPLTCPTQAPNEHITCPSGSKWEKFNGTCYYFETGRNLNWADANQECLMKGASLASVHSRQENDFIYRKLAEKRVYATWVGLIHNGTTWKWTDFSPVDFTFWAPGEPNNEAAKEGCVEIYNVLARPTVRKKWNDLRCTYTRKVVCMKVNH